MPNDYENNSCIANSSQKWVKRMCSGSGEEFAKMSEAAKQRSEWLIYLCDRGAVASIAILFNNHISLIKIVELAQLF
jgi:hypothetical protein